MTCAPVGADVPSAERRRSRDRGDTFIIEEAASVLKHTLRPNTSGTRGGSVNVFVVAERLEVRRFLDGAFVLVDGTDQNDVILIEPDAGGVRVTVNGVSDIRSLDGFKGVQVSGLAGNDHISIAKGMAATTVEGGLGDDTLIGGSGNDSLRGNEGSDDIRGRGGNDRLDGGLGVNRIRG